MGKRFLLVAIVILSMISLCACSEQDPALYGTWELEKSSSSWISFSEDKFSSGRDSYDVVLTQQYYVKNSEITFVSDDYTCKYEIEGDRLTLGCDSDAPVIYVKRK